MAFCAGRRRESQQGEAGRIGRSIRQFVCDPLCLQLKVSAFLIGVSLLVMAFPWVSVQGESLSGISAIFGYRELGVMSILVAFFFLSVCAVGYGAYLLLACPSCVGRAQLYIAFGAGLAFAMLVTFKFSIASSVNNFGGYDPLTGWFYGELFLTIVACGLSAAENIPAEVAG